KNTLEKMKKISRKKILEVLGFFFQKPSLIGGQDSSLASIRSTLDQILGSNVVSVKKKAFLITDHFLIYMIVATIIGARIGHILFYEDPKWFFFHPFDIFKVWEGGLASHGAAIAILGAVFLFSRNYLPKFYPRISFLSFMDLIVIPVSFAAVCIRVGNFFNQEILGTLSNSRVAVIFGHAADGSLPLPRHPVQIYEALGYLVIFGLLWSLSYKILWKEGKLFGLFLVLVFTLRFFIEFLKVEQSVLIQNSYVTMGQYLSLPFIVLGFISLNWNRLRRKVVLK
ncbi:MAG: prolipoprotein diacylglyceryl transferase, partial [Chlamydiota bacterium]